LKKAGLIIVAGWLGLGAQGYAQTISVGVSSGLFFPQEKAYRDIYGTSLPFEIEVRAGLTKYLAFAAGMGYLRDSGQALNVNQGPDRYSVEFRRFSFPVSVVLLFPMDNLSLFAGAGMSLHSYEEKWQTITLTHTGTKIKPLAYAGVEYRVLPRVAARLSVRYEIIRAEKNPSLAKELNLGGLTIQGGVSLKIF